MKFNVLDYKKTVVRSVLGLVIVFCICNVFFLYVSAKNTVEVTISKGVCTVSGKGKMTKPMIPSAKKKKQIKKIYIKKGVTAIPSEAFRKCNKLTSVKISNSVKSIGAYTFADCKKIKKITIPSSVSTIGVNAFYNCSKLKYLTVPGDVKVKYLNSDDVQDYKGASGCILNKCSNIKKVSFNTKLNLCNTIYYRTRAFQVYKKDSKYSSVEGWIFLKDKKTLVAIPHGLNELIMPECCEYIYDSALRRYDTQYPTVIGNRLSKITLSSNTKKIISDISSDFGIEAVSNINYNDATLDTESLRICYYYATSGVVENLTKLMNSYKSKKLLVQFNDHLATEYVVPEGVEIVGKNAFSVYRNNFGIVYDKNIWNLKKVTLPESIHTIEENAFEGQGKLEYINIPRNMKNIANSAFLGTKISG